MIDYTKEEKYGVIKPSCSKWYPGAKVRILQHIEEAGCYIVKNPDSEYANTINEEDIDLI